MESELNPPEASSPAAPRRAAGAVFSRPSTAWWALVGLIFAVGLAVRLYALGDPPVDFHATRQLHSALIARGMYDAGNAQVPGWQRQMAVEQWRIEGVIEPQVNERLAALTYQIAGRADLRIPRLYAILFWMVAGVFLTWLAVDIAGPAGALVAALFFLIWPYGVTASRAFQPEPLMIALLAAALWAAVRWEKRGAWGWAVATGLLAGLSIYVKPTGLFFLGPALLALSWAHFGIRRVFREPQVWAVAALALLPEIAYSVDGLFIHGFLTGQLSLRFFPQMWKDPAFYLRWISNLGRAVPFEMALVALTGSLLLRKPAHRALLLSMWGGYVAYGMALSHHISTHDYYHLPLFPVIALGLAAVAETVFQNLGGPTWLARAVFGAVLIAALVVNGYDARTSIKRSGAVAQAQVWEAVGKALSPGASVVALVPDYGGGLKYYAWIDPSLWPTSDDLQFQSSVGQAESFQSLFKSQVSGRDFFVVSMLDELDLQPQLKQALEKYPLLRQGPGYMIYDLRSPASGQPVP